MAKIKRNIKNRREENKENSWYWSVLLKAYGSVEKAQESINQSRRNVDPTFHG